MVRTRAVFGSVFPYLKYQPGGATISMSRRHLAILVANLALVSAARADSLLSALLNQKLTDVKDDFAADGPFSEAVRDAEITVGLSPKGSPDPGAALKFLIANPFVSFDTASLTLPNGHYLIDRTPEWFAANEQAIETYEHWVYDHFPVDDPHDAPEPGAGGMVLLGIGGLAYARRRRTLRRSAAAACER
jgi:hypothetical protein